MSVRERLAALVRRLDGALRGDRQVEVTEGGIGWPLFALSVPIVVTNLLQTAYNFVDTFWLGQYSTDALAAISFAFPMVFLLISLALGISVAGSVLVAQHTGAGESRAADYAASQTVTFSALASLALGSLAFFVVDDVLALMGASPAVLPKAAAYMRVVSAGLAFMFVFFVFISLMRGYGDTVTPMVVMFGTVVLNIALDPFLIFGWGPFPEWGVAGAAVATVVARGLAMVVGVAILLRGDRGIRIRPREMVPDLSYLRRIVRVGAPASLEITSRSVSVNLLLFIVGLFATTTVAAFGIGIRVFSVIFLPAIAVGRGVETMAGQNIGADKPDRAERTAHFGAVVTFAVLSGAGVVVWLTAEGIVGVFTDNAAVIDTGTTFLRYVAPTFGCLGVVRSYSGALRGAGRTLSAAGIAIVMLWLVRLPVAVVGALRVGEPGLWLSFAVSNVVGATLALAWFRLGRWRDADVSDPRGVPADD